MRSTSTPPERYLVLLSAQSPQIGGFTYPDLDRAVLSLLDTRRRWPRATLVVIPARPKARRAK